MWPLAVSGPFVCGVVHRPRSEKLAQCHDAKGSVRACEIQLRASQAQASQILLNSPYSVGILGESRYPARYPRCCQHPEV